MWRQLDRYLATRMALPWLPVFANAHRPELTVLTPEFFGALAMVLSARVLADRSMAGVLQLLFGILPLLGGGFVVAGATPGDDYSWLGLVYYLGASTGTVLAAITDLRERR